MNLSQLEQAIGHGRRTHRGAAEAGFKTSLVQAINEVFDANTRRVAVVFDRLPGFAFALLVLIAAASLAVAAHNADLSGRMRRWRMSIFAAVLAALMLVILDFDQSRRGFIQVSDAPLQAAVRDMETALAREP